MISKIYFLSCIFLFFSTFLSAQTDKIKYPYYISELTLQNGQVYEGIILEANESSLTLINRKDWRKIKNKSRTALTLEQVMSKNGTTNWQRKQFAYADLGVVDTKSIKKPLPIRWIGLGLGVALGAYVGLVVSQFDCADIGTCGNYDIAVPSILIGGGLGFGLGSIFSVRIPRHKLVKGIDDKGWQESLIKYSILR